MKTLGIKIVNEAHGKQIALGKNTCVYVVLEDEEGNVSEVDISNVTRAVTVNFEMGSVVLAKMECFVTGLESRAEVEELLLRHIKPRKRFWQRLRDVSTFGRRDGVQEYA